MQSDGAANWVEIKRAVEVRNQIKPEIPLHGNGDVLSYEQGIQRIKESGADGVMIGRGIFHNPWFFNPEKTEISQEERIQKLIEHTHLFEKTWSPDKNFNILKRFYKIYLNGFQGAAKLRVDLMLTKNYDEVYTYFKSVLATTN